MSVALATLGSLSLVSFSPIYAVTKVWDGATLDIAGTYNSGLPTVININYDEWDTTTANWSGSTWSPNDDAVFNLASGSNVIRVTANTMNPASMTFTGGANYDFTKSSSAVIPTGTNPSGSNFAGWYSSTGGAQLPAPYNIAGPDSFSSGAISDGAVSTATSVTLGTSAGTGYTGTVILRARPAAVAGFTGVHTIHSGTLEIHDGGALPSANQNTPPVTLNGGTLAVNVDQGSYTFRVNNINPGSTQLAGTLTVTANSNLSNTATDVYGRARQQGQIWNGSMNIAAGTTLTVNTGGGTTIGGASGAAFTGTGTLRIGANAANNGGSNRLRIQGGLTSTGSGILFDLGNDGGILQNNAAVGGTTTLGGVVSNSGTTIAGTTNTASSASPSSTISIGAANGNYSINGVIVNGQSSATGGGSPAGSAPASTRLIANTNLTKAGGGNLTLNNRNFHNGANTVSAGTLTTSNAHALGGGSGAVTVASGATLEMNGVTQTAGKAITLSGGSLVNNTATPTSIHTGATANFTPNVANTAGSGNWSGAGNTPDVTISGGGGSGATARAILQLGWLRFSAADGGAVGSGYASEPKISFSAPDLPASAGGRAIKAVAVISNNGATAGQVTAIDIVDPGFGYTSVPTISIDNTGTGGTGFLPVYSMTAGAIEITNGGSGYTSAPTVTLGGPGYLASSGNGVGGFGSVTLTAATTSNIGGSGDITVSAPVSGAGSLTKVGGGTLVVSSLSNNYSGTTLVSAGTLQVNGTHTGAGAYTVDPSGTLSGTGTINSAFPVTISGKLAPGTSPGTLTLNTNVILNSASTLAMELKGNDTTMGGGVNDLVAGVVDLSLDGTLNVTETVANSFLSATAGDKWRLITYTGNLVDNGLALGSMPALTSGLQFSIEAIAGQINLVVSAVPEASAFLAVGMIATGFAGLNAVRRRRTAR